MRRYKGAFVFNGVDTSQITKLEECMDLLHKVQIASSRANKLIKRRQEEVQKLHKIQEDLAKRIDFLSHGNVESNTWYDHKAQQRRFFCHSVEKDDTLRGWEFDLQANIPNSDVEIRLDYHTNEILLGDPSSNSIISLPLKEEKYIVQKYVEVKQAHYSTKGAQSFLSLWVLSNGLSQAVKDPDILTIKSILDEMWDQNNKRSISKGYNDDRQSEIAFAKYQDKWHIVLFVR